MVAGYHLIWTTYEKEVQGIAASFDDLVRRHGYTCYACAIMPDHIHILIRKHRDIAETMIVYFQDESRKTVLRLGRREPYHPVWGGPGWEVFLETCEDMFRTVDYTSRGMK
jgi:REP element-mobilizing transposase RayT